MIQSSRSKSLGKKLWYDVKGLVARNTQVKYGSPISLLVHKLWLWSMFLKSRSNFQGFKFLSSNDNDDDDKNVANATTDTWAKTIVLRTFVTANYKCSKLALKIKSIILIFNKSFKLIGSLSVQMKYIIPCQTSVVFFIFHSNMNSPSFCFEDLVSWKCLSCPWLWSSGLDPGKSYASCLPGQHCGWMSLTPKQSLGYDRVWHLLTHWT